MTNFLLLLFGIIPSRYQDARHCSGAWHQTFLSSPDQFVYQKDLCNVLKSRNHQRIMVFLWKLSCRRNEATSSGKRYLIQINPSGKISAKIFFMMHYAPGDLMLTCYASKLT